MFVNQCFIAPCLQTLRLQKNDSRLSRLGLLPEMTWEMTLEKTSYKKAQVMLTCHLGEWENGRMGEWENGSEFLEK